MEVHETGSEIIFSEKQTKKKGITSSTDCQLVSLERLGWRRRLFEQKTPLARPARLSRSRAADLPSASTHTYTHTEFRHCIYVLLNTITHRHG